MSLKNVKIWENVKERGGEEDVLLLAAAVLVDRGCGGLRGGLSDQCQLLRSQEPVPLCDGACLLVRTLFLLM